MKKLVLLLVLFCGSQVSAQSEAKIYRSTEVDIKPQLESGMYTLTKFISENFKFPELRNKRVTIFTSFVIEPDGSMQDEKAFSIVAKDYLSESTTAPTEQQRLQETESLEMMKFEALRILKLFTEKWETAKIAGQPVRCLYNYPITFNLE